MFKMNLSRLWLIYHEIRGENLIGQGCFKGVFFPALFRLFWLDKYVYAKCPVTGGKGLICMLCLDFVGPDSPGNGAYEWSRFHYR